VKTSLQLFLADIEPIPDRIGRLVDVAVETFPWRIAGFAHGDEYTAWLAALYCHLECTVLGLPGRRANPVLDLCRAWDLLRRPYGGDTPQTLYDVARSGSEGGLRQIMNTLAERYGDEYTEQLVSNAVTCYMADRSPAKLLSDAREYVALHGNIIPSEISEGSPARIASHFPKVLALHPLAMQRLRQTGR
jgi:hypothetical protein